MTQIEKIKAEIERLKNELSYNKERLNLREIIAVNNCYNNLIFFIDSLSDTEKDFGIKESVIPFGASDSELMEATYFISQGYHVVIDGDKVIIKKGEEPVSNDLEEAANDYAHDLVHDDVFETFIAGAQWQALHSLETIKGMEEQAFLAGVEAEQINKSFSKEELLNRWRNKL